MSDYVLPTEICIEEILTRLPVKTLLRCTSVCKSWYSLITSPNFISLHLNRTTSNQNNRLLVRSLDDVERYSVHTDNETFDMLERLNFPFHSRNSFFDIVGTCNGLVCLSDDARDYTDLTILWNPSIRKVLELPSPNVRFWSHGPFHHTLGFGFNPVTNDYNVVRVMYLQKSEPVWGYKFPPVVELYELSTGSWRGVSAGDFSFVINQRARPVVLNGVIHWVGNSGKKDHNLIVSFDLKSETFGVMRVPHRAKKELDVRVTLFEESLALIDERLFECCYVWVMKEYGVENTWTRQFKIHTTTLRHLTVGFKNNGNVLLAESRYSGDLVFYDPKRRKVKKLGIRGCGGSFYISTYMESLVLINGKNDVLGMQEITHGANSLLQKKRKKSSN
ncbi:hypothetical protein LguiA_022338 [Lonicera macranthoides]